MEWGNLFEMGAQVSIISDVLRSITFLLDSLIYGLIPSVFKAIYGLFDINEVLGADNVNNILATMKNTIYSFLAIAMFFRVAFSLLEMLVDPAKIDDKEKGAGKIATNIVICLVLLIAMGPIFDTAKEIQSKILNEKMIERAIIGSSYGEDNSSLLGNELALSTWSVFLVPTVNSGRAYDAYVNTFGSENNRPSYWSLSTVGDHLLDVTGVPIISDIASRLGINWIGQILGGGSYYELSYTIFISTIVGIYLLWTIVKLCIDVAYRSIKFLALELLSPIAVISIIDPSSSKKGLFSKWLSETLSTYLSLFIRIFVFALCSVLLKTFQNFNGGLKIFYILAVIAFLKSAPKFIDKLFGTELSKDSDTKFASDLLRGGLGLIGGAAVGGIGNAVVAKRNKMPIGKSAWEGIKKGATGGFTSARKGDLLGYGKSIYSGVTGEAGSGYYGIQKYSDAKKQEDRLKWAKERAKRVASESESHSFLKTNPKGEGEFRDKLIDTYKNGTDKQKKFAGEFLEHMGMATRDEEGNLKIIDAVKKKDENGNEVIDDIATSNADRERSALKTDADRAKVRALYGKAMASTEIFSESSDVGKQMQDNAMNSFTAYREQAKADLVSAVAGDFGKQFDLSIKTGSLSTLVADFESQLNSSFITEDLKNKLKNGISISTDASKGFEQKIQELQPLLSEIETEYSLISKNATGQSQYYTAKAEDASKALGAMKNDPKTRADAMILELAKEGDPYITTGEIKAEANNLNDRSGYNARSARRNTNKKATTYTSEYDSDNIKGKDDINSDRTKEKTNSDAFNILMGNDTNTNHHTDDQIIDDDDKK